MEQRISPWCTTFGYEVVMAENVPDYALWRNNPTVFRLKDLFTTRDGHWYYEEGFVGGIPQWAIADYDKATFTERGGATHLFGLILRKDGTVEPATQICYWYPDFDQIGTWNWQPPVPSWVTIQNTNPSSGWANITIEHSSGYNYVAGTHGVHHYKKGGGASDAVRYVGLPLSWHVSTFAVFQEVDVNDGGNGGGIPVDTTVKALLLQAQADLEGLEAQVSHARTHLDEALALLG